jgi:hypothetical protein
MGGFGSTRWNWSSTKDTVEANPSLDIDGLNRAGCLRPGYRGSWKWTRDGGRIASIQLRRDINTLVLSYRIGYGRMAANGRMSSNQHRLFPRMPLD